MRRAQAGSPPSRSSRGNAAVVTIATERPGSLQILKDASDDARRVEPLRAEDVLTASAAWRRRSSSREVVATSGCSGVPGFDRDSPRDRPAAAGAG